MTTTNEIAVLLTEVLAEILADLQVMQTKVDIILGVLIGICTFGFFLVISRYYYGKFK